MIADWLPAVIVLAALAVTCVSLVLVRRRRRRFRPAGREVVIKVERM